MFQTNVQNKQTDANNNGKCGKNKTEGKNKKAGFNYEKQQKIF